MPQALVIIEDRAKNDENQPEQEILEKYDFVSMPDEGSIVTVRYDSMLNRHGVVCVMHWPISCETGEETGSFVPPPSEPIVHMILNWTGVA